VDKLLGKGLGLGIILEYIFLNLAWIIALSVPMSVLISVLMVYGRLSEDNEITAIRSSGISIVSIVRPSLIFAIFVTILLTLFNNYILPDFNHKARLLGSDIYRKHPDLNIEPGYFIEDLPDYNLFVYEKEGDTLKDISIYSKNNTNVQTTIRAKSGFLKVKGNSVVLTLFNGEIHELDMTNMEEYRRIDFIKHAIVIPVDNLILERHDSKRRGDREMSIPMMYENVKSYLKKIENIDRRIRKITFKDFSDSTINLYILPKKIQQKIDSIQSLISEEGESTLKQSKETKRLQKLKERLRSEFSIRESYERQVNKYMVEIYKKFSIPFASIVFVLIGAPLGIISRKGGLAMATGFSIFFFILYWAGLIGGEELADRNIIPPFWAMWAPNIIIGIFGILLTIRTIHERTEIKFPVGIFQKIFSKVK
jgi:lipopolysaccharide export system permease protein